MKYTEFEFNKQDATYTRQIDTLKKLVECAENESSNLIDGVSYPVSTTWREIAQIALDLADGADWFDRYYKMNDNKKKITALLYCTIKRKMANNMNDLSLLNPTERKVYECIPVGSAHPISQEKLANLVKTSRRSVAEIIQHLRHKGFLIGSSRAYPVGSGYYKISNENEYFMCIGMLTASRDNLTQTIKAMTKRHSEQGLEPNAQKKSTEGQLDLLKDCN